MLEAARLLRVRLTAAAAELLEVAVDDLVLQDGQVAPVGAEQRAVPLAEVVRFALAKESRGAGEDAARALDGLHEDVRFQAEGESFPFGTTIAVVAIDRETGHPRVERYVSVDDVGNVVHPLLVEAQLIGGAVQGLGETLWEVVAYDPDGQLLTGSLMDYAAPKASWLPTFELDRTVTPSPNNPLGAKGVGEAGTVHAPPAVANAVMDALRPFGVEPLDLPLTGQKLWRIIQFGGRGVR
jgi:carbon-monoxide dehydrogenase large subunit